MLLSKTSLRQGIKRVLLGSHGALLKTAMVLRYRWKHPREVDACIETFVGDGIKGDASRMRALRKAVHRDMFAHLITPDEYFLYGFERLSEEEKSEFVGDIERVILCARLYNDNPAGQLFMNKMETFRVFSPFFKREVVSVESEEDRGAFLAFAAKHRSFMAKPVATSRGQGIHRVDVARGEAESAFGHLLQIGPCVVEELIDQAPEMAAFHPQSVNTIRYATYLEDGEVRTIACFVKLGRGGSVIDNGGAGGLLASVDVETGVVTTPGRTEFGEGFSVHPDTGTAIVGAQIPSWGELRALVRKLAFVLPEQKYVGWDLAYSTQGWVLVEGNSGGQFVGPQISMKQGIRPIVEATFGRI